MEVIAFQALPMISNAFITGTLVGSIKETKWVVLMLYHVNTTYSHLYSREHLKKVGESANTEIRQKLKQLDIDAQIEAVEALIQPLKKSGSVKKGSVLYICLKNVTDAIENIKTSLKKLEQTVFEHRQKIFASWRPTGYADILNVLEEDMILLHTRMDMLVKVLMLPEKTYQLTNSKWYHFKKDKASTSATKTLLEQLN